MKKRTRSEAHKKGNSNAKSLQPKTTKDDAIFLHVAEQRNVSHERKDKYLFGWTYESPHKIGVSPDVCSHWDLVTALTELVAPNLRRSRVANAEDVQVRAVKSRSFEEYVVDDYEMIQGTTNETTRGFFSRFRSPKSVIWTFLFRDQHMEASEWSVSSQLERPLLAASVLSRFGATVHLLQSNVHLKLWNQDCQVFQSVISQHRKSRKRTKGPIHAPEIDKLLTLLYDESSNWPVHADKTRDFLICVHLPSEEALGPCLDPFLKAIQTTQLPASAMGLEDSQSEQASVVLLQEEHRGQVFLNGVRLLDALPLFSFGFSVFRKQTSALDICTLVSDVLRQEFEDQDPLCTPRQQEIAGRLIRDFGSTHYLPPPLRLQDLDFLKVPLALAHQHNVVPSNVPSQHSLKVVRIRSLLAHFLKDLEIRSFEEELPNSPSSSDEEEHPFKTIDPEDAETEPPTSSSEGEPDEGKRHLDCVSVCSTGKKTQAILTVSFPFKKTVEQSLVVKCPDEKQRRHLATLRADKHTWNDCRKLMEWFRDSVSSYYVNGFWGNVQFCCYEPQESIGFFRVETPESLKSELEFFLNVNSVCWNLKHPWPTTMSRDQILALVFQALFEFESLEQPTRKMSLVNDIAQLISIARYDE